MRRFQLRSAIKKEVIFLSIFSFLVLVSCGSKGDIRLKAGGLDLEINNTGSLTKIADELSGVNYHFNDTISPLLSVRVKNQLLLPIGAKLDDQQIITLEFNGQITAQIKVEEKGSHLRLS